MPGSEGEIRVLHVDDEPGLADVVAMHLEREDGALAVETASSAAEGLEYLAGNAVDCVVSDYDMPGTNGIEFLEAVREDHPDLPFILYTGKGSEEVASEAISAMVTDYLQKESGTGQYAVLANRIRNAVERYRSQRELEANRRRLALFFEESPLGVIEWNEAFEVVRANDTAERILGYDGTDADLAGRSWESFVPEGDREAVDEVVTELLAADGGYHSVNRNRRADGEVIVCEWHNRVVTDGAGEVVAIFSQFRDVTERHRRRQRRERQREALVELATDEAVTDGEFGAGVRRITETAAEVLDVDRVNVWLFEDDREALRCVDDYDRRTDAHGSGAELVAENYPAYFAALEHNRTVAAADAASHPATRELAESYLDVENVGALLDATLRSKGEVIGVVCHEHVGGTRDWTDDEVGFAGEVAGVVHRAYRNRQRVERRRELQFQRSLLAAQGAAVGDGILVLDTDGAVVSYNDRLLDLWGIDPAVPVDADPRQRKAREGRTEDGGAGGYRTEDRDPRDGEAVLGSMAERLADPGSFRETVVAPGDGTGAPARETFELADGRVLDAETRPVTGEDGTRYGRLWTFRDAADRAGPDPR